MAEAKLEQGSLPPENPVVNTHENLQENKSPMVGFYLFAFLGIGLGVLQILQFFPGFQMLGLASMPKISVLIYMGASVIAAIIIPSFLFWDVIKIKKNDELIITFGFISLFAVFSILSITQPSWLTSSVQLGVGSAMVVLVLVMAAYKIYQYCKGKTTRRDSHQSNTAFLAVSEQNQCLDNNRNLGSDVPVLATAAESNTLHENSFLTPEKDQKYNLSANRNLNGSFDDAVDNAANISTSSSIIEETRVSLQYKRERLDLYATNIRKLQLETSDPLSCTQEKKQGLQVLIQKKIVLAGEIAALEEKEAEQQAQRNSLTQINSSQYNDSDSQISQHSPATPISSQPSPAIPGYHQGFGTIYSAQPQQQSYSPIGKDSSGDRGQKTSNRNLDNLAQQDSGDRREKIGDWEKMPIRGRRQ